MNVHTVSLRRALLLRLGGASLSRAGRTLVLVAAAVLLFGAPVLAEEYIYKWKDANGTTVYSDRVPSGPAQRIVVDVKPPDPEADRARQEAEREGWARADAEREARRMAEEAQRQALVRQRAEQCRAARSRSARFSVDGRQYRLDEKGERVYYSAQEIDRERAESKKQMDEFCAPASKRP